MAAEIPRVKMLAASESKDFVVSSSFFNFRLISRYALLTEFWLNDSKFQAKTVFCLITFFSSASLFYLERIYT